MIFQRLIAMALILLAGAVLGRMSGDVTFAVILCGAGLVGLPGRIRWELRPSRRVIVTLILWTAIVIDWRFGAISSVVGGQEFQSQAVPVAKCFLMVMVLQFYVSARSSMPAMLPLACLGVLLCQPYVGDSREGYQSNVLMLSAYIPLAAAYWARCRPVVVGLRGERRWWSGRIVTGAAVIAAAMAAGWVAGPMIWDQQHVDQVRDSRLASGGGKHGDKADKKAKSTKSLFARKADLNNVEKIKMMDPNVPALRVYSDKVPGYMRIRVFDRYRRSRWWTRRLGKRVQASASPESVDLPGAGDDNVFVLRQASGDVNVMDVWLAQTVCGVFSPAGTYVVRADVEKVFVGAGGVVDAAVEAGDNYSLAMDSDYLPRRLGRVERQLHLALPADMDARIGKLKEIVFDGCITASQKMYAVESYLRATHAYSLDVKMPADKDPLTHFLVSKSAGHCEYFATAAAVLLRLGGVPTRYVIGFVVNEQSIHGDYWIARNKDAHAWVEAWDNAQGRWVLVEATSSRSAAANRQPKPRCKAAKLAEHVEFRIQELKVTARKDGVVGVMGWCCRRVLGLLAIPIVACVFGVIVLLLAVVVFRRRLRRGGCGLRKSDELLVTLQRLLNKMDGRMGRRGLARRSGETIHQFAGRISAQLPDDPAVTVAAVWFRQYATIRYGCVSTVADVADLQESMPNKSM